MKTQFQTDQERLRQLCEDNTKLCKVVEQARELLRDVLKRGSVDDLLTINIRAFLDGEDHE